MRTKLRLILAATLLGAPCALRAETYPLLEQLNQQTQSLYRDVQSGLVRVQLPTPKWIRDAAAKDDPLRKWDKVIDPQVKAKIDQQRSEIAQRGVMSRKFESVIVTPSSQPSAAVDKVDVGGAWRVVKSESTGEIVLEPRGSGGNALVLHAGADGSAGPPNLNIGGALRLRAIAGGSFAPNNIGLLISEEGHILVPLFVERETIGNNSVTCMVADQQTTATFIGSDEKTNLTLLKMDRVIGKPIRIGQGRPMDGSLVMMLNPNNGSGRVQLWTGGERDFGVVVSMDGSVAGFARYGQFLNTAAAKPVIDQLLNIGRVQRAVLGVRLTELRADHEARQRFQKLGERPALSVDEVTPGSPAEKAGLAAGDLILELQEQPIGDLTTWSALLAGGGEGRLLVLRNGELRPIKLDLHPAE
ncbi:MAG TPA: PDZ domain-containing protein [Tepidisphaeraceae bacterium]|jgi:hypothetical protein|nr:PDZ domain-containing protein [Tepidisphaeraceae bacterium]